MIICSRERVEDDCDRGDEVADDDCCKWQSASKPLDSAALEGWNHVPMKAWYQLRPNGMRALPVMYVAILQLIRSPVRDREHNAVYRPAGSERSLTVVMELEVSPRPSRGLNRPDVIILVRGQLPRVDVASTRGANLRSIDSRTEAPHV